MDDTQRLAIFVSLGMGVSQPPSDTADDEDGKFAGKDTALFA
jgi:hypothetical protein